MPMMQWGDRWFLTECFSFGKCTLSNSEKKFQWFRAVSLKSDDSIMKCRHRLSLKKSNAEGPLPKFGQTVVGAGGGRRGAYDVGGRGVGTWGSLGGRNDLRKLSKTCCSILHMAHTGWGRKNGVHEDRVRIRRAPGPNRAVGLRGSGMRSGFRIWKFERADSGWDFWRPFFFESDSASHTCSVIKYSKPVIYLFAIFPETRQKIPRFMRLLCKRNLKYFLLKIATKGIYKWGG